MSTPTKTTPTTTPPTRTTTTTPTTTTRTTATPTNRTTTTPPTTTPTTPTTTTKNIGTVYPFDAINEPGAYICNWSGHLLRVPEEVVTAGRTPLLNIVGNEPLTVTKISDNPYIPITKAKAAAATFDLTANF